NSCVVVAWGTPLLSSCLSEVSTQCVGRTDRCEYKQKRRDLHHHVIDGGDERIRTAGAAFAEPCLTTWRRRRMKTTGSGRRGSNPRLSPWQGDALPLSHSRRYLAFARLRYH